MEGDTEKAIEVVTGVVTVDKLFTSLPLVQGDTCPQALIQTAVLLHSVLPSLQDHKLFNNFCIPLVSWYTLELPERDNLTSNCLLLLLKRSLSTQGTKADVQRIWNLHQTILGFRLGESEELRTLLVSTIGSTLYLTSAEGCR